MKTTFKIDSYELWVHSRKLRKANGRKSKI